MGSRPGWLTDVAYITIGATGAPTIESGPPGVSISRTSTGLYALAFPTAILVVPSYGIIKSATITTIRGTAISQSAGTASFTTLAGDGTALTIDDDSAGTPDTVDWSVGPFPDPTDTPADADALRDDLVATFFPVLRDAFATISDRIEDGGTALAVADPGNGDILKVTFDVKFEA